MIDQILIIPILASFFVTLFLIPAWIRKAKAMGLVGKDIHKKDKEEVAESGGINIVVGFAAGVLLYIALNTFVFRSDTNLIKIFSLLCSVLLIAFVAFSDDIIYLANWKTGLRRRTRLVLVAFASIPLVVINAGKSSIILPFLGSVEFGLFYPLFLIPLGIVGATTTFNFLAGFNGLEAGLGVLILSALAIVAYFTGSAWLTVVALCMVASLLAFLIFNFNPAKIFPGDTLTYSVGVMIAIMAILGNFEKIALFFFIPCVIEVFLKGRGRFVKESYGRLMENGYLDLRYRKIYSLNHLAIYLMQKYDMKPTEIKVVFSIWIFQIVVILIGFLIFRNGIFT